jgi:hypothetical protein
MTLRAERKSDEVTASVERASLALDRAGAKFLRVAAASRVASAPGGPGARPKLG